MLLECSLTALWSLSDLEWWKLTALDKLAPNGQKDRHCDSLSSCRSQKYHPDTQKMLSHGVVPDPSKRGLNCSHASVIMKISKWVAVDPWLCMLKVWAKKICSDLILGNGCKVLAGNNVSSKCYHYSILVSISTCSWQWPGDHSAAVCAFISLNHCNTGITWDMQEFSATWESQLVRTEWPCQMSNLPGVATLSFTKLNIFIKIFSTV